MSKIIVAYTHRSHPIGAVLGGVFAGLSVKAAFDVPGTSQVSALDIREAVALFLLSSRREEDAPFSRERHAWLLNNVQ